MPNEPRSTSDKSKEPEVLPPGSNWVIRVDGSASTRSNTYGPFKSHADADAMVEKFKQFEKVGDSLPGQIHAYDLDIAGETVSITTGHADTKRLLHPSRFEKDWAWINTEVESAEKVVDHLLNEDDATELEKFVNDTPSKTFKAWFNSRDHSEDPDERATRKMLRKIPGSHDFEFGNNVIDEYVTVVTDCPWLEEKITESLDHENIGHNLVMVDGIVTFSAWEDLQKKAEEAMRNAEDEWDAAG